MDPTSRVIVIRAWLEAGHVRARILVDDGRTESQVVDNAKAAATLVERLLYALESGGDPE